MMAENLFKLVTSFVFYYPVAMGVIWMLGSTLFWFIKERNTDNKADWPEKWPQLIILVPCHNESQTITITCKNLLHLDYPDYHVLFIDDASTDDTAKLLRSFVNKVPFFHLLKLQNNQGKANALNIALGLVKTKFVMVLDADTILAEDATKHFVASLLKSENIGAVTGNVFVIDKSGFLNKFQAGEFSSIFSLIKRCQYMLGYLFTVSGCATIYRLEALMQVGGFSVSTATEDIDITWRIHRNFMKVCFEPKAIVYIQTPKKLMQYISQRKRWVAGGWHFLRQHIEIFRNLKLWNSWITYIEFMMSYIWAFCFAGTTIFWIISQIALFEAKIDLGWSIALASFTFVLQALIATFINNHYDPGVKKCFLLVCWYPVLFFMFGVGLILWTAPKGLFGKLKGAGKWNSPKREAFDISKK